MDKRGIAKDMVNSYVSNGKSLSQGGGKYAFVSPEGVAVVGSDGTLVTAGTKNNFDASMLEVIKNYLGRITNTCIE